METKKGTGVAGFLNRWIENTSEASEDLHKLADRVAREQAESGERFQKQLQDAGVIAEQNIKDANVRSVAGKAGLWVSKPFNLAVTMGIIFLILFGLYRA